MTVALSRLTDWPEQLAAFIQSRESTPFAWGGNDCVLHAADAVQAMTGTDPVAEFRGAWSDEESARAVLDGMGGLLAAVGLTLGTPLASPRLAQRGDIVLVPGVDGGQTLGVCCGSWWAAPSAEGHARGPMMAAAMAWAVGREVGP